MEIIIFFIAQWYLSFFSQSFFDHRYASHRAFTMNKFWERFFYIFAFITQGATYMSPRAYAVMHRMHHAYTDTDKDPHSPDYSPNLFAMMWRTRQIYTDVYYERYDVEARFLKNVPDWKWFDKWADSRFVKILWVGAYVAFYVYFATTPWLYLLLPFTILMEPTHGVIVNWYGHKIGYRNYDLNNKSRNLVPVDLFLLGEAYHNDHHRFPSAIKFGVKWYEIDIVHWLILLFSKLGIVRLAKKRNTSEDVMESMEMEY